MDNIVISALCHASSKSDEIKMTALADRIDVIIKKITSQLKNVEEDPIEQYDEDIKRVDEKIDQLPEQKRKEQEERAKLQTRKDEYQKLLKNKPPDEDEASQQTNNTLPTAPSAPTPRTTIV